MTEAKTPFEGSSTLISGMPGSGKTYAIATALQAGLKVAAVFTEPRGPQSILEAVEHYDAPIENLYYRYISPASPSWDSMVKSSKLINSLTFEGLTQLKQGMDKSEYGQWIELLNALADFTCERTGEHIGPVDALDTDWMVAVDGLSGMSIMSMDLTVGAKPVKAMGEWGVAMDNMERLILKLCSDVPAHLCVISHIEREHDEISGGYQNMVSALGRKLPPKIPRFFSDHVFAKKKGKEFIWSTADDNTDTKSRLLPISESLEPSFLPMIEEWNRRKELAEKSASKSNKGVDPEVAKAS